MTVDIKPKAIEFTAGRVAAFAGGVKQSRTYRLSLQLREEVDDSGSEYFLRHDHVRIELPKERGGGSVLCSTCTSPCPRKPSTEASISVAWSMYFSRDPRSEKPGRCAVQCSRWI